MGLNWSLGWAGPALAVLAWGCVHRPYWVGHVALFHPNSEFYFQKTGPLCPCFDFGFEFYIFKIPSQNGVSVDHAGGFFILSLKKAQIFDVKSNLVLPALDCINDNFFLFFFFCSNQILCTTLTLNFLILLLSFKF